MLVIRYNRVGRRNKAQFRIVVQEHTTAPGGRHVAIVGSYDPHTKEVTLKKDEIKEWMSKGAQPSDSVWNLLVKEGVVEGEKRKIKMKKKPAEESEEGADKAKEVKDDASVEETKEEKKEDAPAEDAKEEKKEEVKEEVVAEPKEEKEEVSEESKKEETNEVKEEKADAPVEEEKLNDEKKE